MENYSWKWISFRQILQISLWLLTDTLPLLGTKEKHRFYNSIPSGLSNVAPTNTVFLKTTPKNIIISHTSKT